MNDDEAIRSSLARISGSRDARTPSLQELHSRRTRRHRRLIGVTLSLLLIALIGSVVLLSTYGDASRSDLAYESSNVSSDSGAPGTTATSSALSSVESQCVEAFSLEALRRRAFAIDGVVTSVEPINERNSTATTSLPSGRYLVTLDVLSNFAGSPTTALAVILQSSFPEGEELFVEGERLLVSGEILPGEPDDPTYLGWACGFTQEWSPTAAQEWHDAFGSTP